MILQSRGDKIKKVGIFDKKMQKNAAFSWDYLVNSKKSSTFACFFAARECAHVCIGCEKVMKKSKTKRLN